MLLACTLILGLAVPASAEYMYRGYEFNPDSTGSKFTQVGQGNSQSDMSTAKYYDMSNSNLFLIAYYILRNLDGSSIKKYLSDQKDNASFFPVQYLAYALHGLKGSFVNSGTLVSMTPDNGSGVGYVYTGASDYFASTWVGSRPTITSTDANRWRIQTLSDSHSGSWMYQVAHSLAQSGLTMEALMNWSNPDGGTLYVPATSATYSWFYQMLQAVNNSNVDVSGLATESTLSSVKSTLNRSLGSSTASFPYIRGSKFDSTPFYSNISNIRGSSTSSSVFDAMNSNLYSLYGLFAPYSDSSGLKLGSTYSTSKFSLDSSFSKSTSNYTNLTFLQAVSYALNLSNYGLSAINSNLLKLDEILLTENDRALKDATDGFKPNVSNYVSDKGSNYGDSFTIGDTISGGLKPDLSTSDASSAIGGLFSPDSSDYWGWFSSATDSDLHPAASGVSTLSLDDEPSSQDIADSEAVWVINPYASSSDLVSDFFGGE